jgi:zinc protease
MDPCPGRGYGPRHMPRAAPAAPLVDVDAVRTRVLPNGLRLRVLREAGSPTVSYATFFQVGSRNERPGITGISHLFEHMMFNGAAKYGPKQFDRVLESRGGASNAYTSNDLTVYYEDFAADALETVMDLESDRMRSLRIDDEALEQEREVVKEERRLRTDNSVYGLMEEALEAMVHQAHPYRWPVIGWMSDIERISRADCEAYFRTFYAPGNAAIYVVGDLDPEATLALLAGAYGDIPAGPAPAPVATGEPDQRGERRAEIRYPAQGPALLCGWRGAAARSADAAALDVAQVCLGVGESSRLRRRLVHQAAVATSVGVSFGWRIDPGVFSVFVELSPGVKVEPVERMLAVELSRLAERGVAAAELKRARALLRSSVLHELGTHHGLAQALGQGEALQGDWREAGRVLELYARVTTADVQRVVREYLAAGRRNTVVLVPERAP